MMPVEVVRLHVHHGDSIELFDLFGRDGLDVDVEQVRHAEVLRPGDPFIAAMTAVALVRWRSVRSARPLAMASGIGLVVEKNEDAVGVGQISLILLHARARQRSAELGEQGAFEQLRQRQIRDIGKLLAQGFVARLLVGRADAQHVDQQAAGVANRVDHLREVPPPGIFDDDASLG